MDSDANRAQAARQMQETFAAGLQQAMGAMASGMPPGFAFPSGASGANGAQGQPMLQFDPAKLQELQQRYIADASALWNQGLQDGADTLVASDRRFSNEAWKTNPVSKFSASTYLLNARTLMELADAVQSDAKTRARVRFAVEQWMAATAPSNFLALNAEAQQKAIQSQGESIAQGITNLLHDMKQGHVSMTDERVFEVGKNVATTEGAVVFENEFFQLLEYKPLTAKVYEKPFLLIPPCINKFYILDLQPENSLIRYAVSQGHRTFVVSWRNPDESMAGKTWDDYIEHAAIKAIEVVQEITGARTLNALGFCVGGTILGTALSVLAARGKKPVASATLLTSFLDFSDTGILDIFIDETSVKYREAEMGQGGLLKGQDLASTFSFLRPNDLVWNYVVGNYLKGETPPPFDLLYWNSDSTNLPGPFYAWYLRNTYFENNLIKPGKAVVCGQKVDLRKVDIPVYLYGSREDHIVPIGGAYASTQHLPGPKRFVMGASGHIAGVINPPAKKKRSYWTRDKLPQGKFPATQTEWLKGATEHPGSWWTDWSDWLKGHAGKQVAAPKAYGSRKYPVIEPAPGRYVKAKA
ncbi:poly(R)-hydroxyalkanoic acid synthase, class I [Polaromonas sp. CF318]|uniref:class I poly(R)-hydroxyalkanoic acid synthase n=1 Tax=Polaromonas sp. CF318 TaxID=1144318 RepID=UPI000270DB1A|nr:class I poly(R)-hydroxyalkanoic acid synthase [Polaromonas sp. CF318]EJL85374.1 poly(R)-hydroxyalkanoic acid synthase, class I [Polaromonas sp. CF318]